MVEELPNALNNQPRVTVVCTFEVLVFRLLGLAEIKMVIEVGENYFEAFGEAIEVFTVKLNSEYSLVS